MASFLNEELRDCLVKETTINSPTLTWFWACFGRADRFFPNMTWPFFRVLFPMDMTLRHLDNVWYREYRDDLFSPLVRTSVNSNHTYVLYARYFPTVTIWNFNISILPPFEHFHNIFMWIYLCHIFCVNKYSGWFRSRKSCFWD